MSVTCECGRPVADARVCSSCAAGVARDLGDVAEWLADELDTMLARLAVFGDRQGARSGVVPLPYDKAASEAVYVLRSTLVSTVRVVASERGLAEPEAPVRAITHPRRSDWTSTGPRGAQNGAQRCGQTDLLVEHCAHCRMSA